MELRALTYLDVLQPQVAGFIQTVAQGMMPLDGQAALVVEIAPGIAVNALTDAALKRTRVVPGMQIVERAYGLLELHAFDQGEVRQASAAILERLGVAETERLAPRVLSREIIMGIDAHQSSMINRMRHGQMLAAGQTLYTLEEVGAILNLTRERIRQVEVRGLAKIKDHTGEELGLPPERA